MRVWQFLCKFIVITTGGACDFLTIETFFFQTRNIQLEPRNEVKVGRSVPRSRVEESNAIFDCKVLSRNHAIIWFHEGKFFIKVSDS